MIVMSNFKRVLFLALLLNLPMIIFAYALGFGSGLENMYHWALAVIFFTFLAIPLLILGLAVQRPKLSRMIGRVGLVIFALALFGQVGGYYYKFNGVWQPEKYAQMNEQTEQVRQILIGQDNLAIEEDDWPRVLDLMQQITYRNPNYWIKSPGDLLPEANYNCRFLVCYADDSCQSVILYPPYYLGYESAYRAGDEQVCQQLADLYSELRIKYEPAALAAAE